MLQSPRTPNMPTPRFSWKERDGRIFVVSVLFSATARGLSWSSAAMEVNHLHAHHSHTCHVGDAIRLPQNWSGFRQNRLPDLCDRAPFRLLLMCFHPQSHRTRAAGGQRLTPPSSGHPTTTTTTTTSPPPPPLPSWGNNAYRYRYR